MTNILSPQKKNRTTRTHLILRKSTPLNPRYHSLTTFCSPTFLIHRRASLCFSPLLLQHPTSISFPHMLLRLFPTARLLPSSRSVPKLERWTRDIHTHESLARPRALAVIYRRAHPPASRPLELYIALLPRGRAGRVINGRSVARCPPTTTTTLAAAASWSSSSRLDNNNGDINDAVGAAACVDARQKSGWKRFGRMIRGCGRVVVGMLSGKLIYEMRWLSAL